MRILILFWLTCCVILSAKAQKLLVLEKANKAQTIKLAVGEKITFRLQGEENYWYTRTIQSIMPEQNALLLDEYLVKLEDINALKMHRNTGMRILGSTFMAFGISLAVATTIAALDRSDENYGLLIGCTLSSLGGGRLMLTKKKIKLGDRHRLRIIEIPEAKDLLIPPPPKIGKG